MAVATLGFGLIPVVMIASPSGPQGRRDESIALGVGIVCLVMAALWLRRSWPSKARSAVYVVIASLCIAASCLVQSNPIAGMLGCTAFAALAGYIAFFHTARLMVFNAVVALATSTVLAFREAHFGDAVLAGCAFALVAVVFVLVPFACHALVQLMQVGLPNHEIDPLTGLLNRDAFYRLTAELVSARVRVDDRYLVIVLLTLDNFNLLTGTDGQVAGDRARIAVAQTLRENTRGDAIVAHSGKAEYLIADTFSSTDATPLVERVRGAVATTPPRLTASMGVVCTPLRALADLPPHDVLDKLIGIADTAMGEARRAGGNQARYIECAAPTLDDRGSDIDDTW